MLQQEQKNKELREILRKNVPSYTSDGLTKDLCEDTLEIFGSLYPGQALSLCMKIAQRVELHKNSIKPADQKRRLEKPVGMKQKEKSRQMGVQRSRTKAH